MKLLGVTGCPTGVAHTFMAAEALSEAAKKAGCTIKVETWGAVGVENNLTEEEIAEADAIIIASDKDADIERFAGKPVIQTSVANGMKKADELVAQCVNGEAEILGGGSASDGDKNTATSKTAAGKKAAEDLKNATKNTIENKKNSRTSKGANIGQTIYKSLMNGVSHMLPLVVAGGILTAISFLWGIYSADPTSDQYNEIAAFIKQIGSISMGLMVPVLTAFIAQSISNRPGMLAGFVAGMIAVETGSGFLGGIIGGFLSGYVCLGLIQLMKNLPKSLEALKSIFIIPLISVAVVGSIMYLIGYPCSTASEALKEFLSGMADSNAILLGIIVGCMCAFDMGGPVNKAAYVTGTALLADGNYYFMAGVSAACITPPLIIAIAATFKKNRFTKAERSAALINYILGCTHITEGAIPFAAKNPLKVIPVLMVGSSLSAVLSYVFDITVPAPHGGFLILPLVNNPLLWVGCILAGSVLGAILYVIVTPKVEE